MDYKLIQKIFRALLTSISRNNSVDASGTLSMQIKRRWTCWVTLKRISGEEYIELHADKAAITNIFNLLQQNHPVSITLRNYFVRTAQPGCTN